MKRKTMKARLSLALASLIASTSALAGTDHIFGSWNFIQLTGNFNKDFRWSIMDAVRTRDDKHLNPATPNAGFSPRFFEDLIWVSAGYNLTEHSSIWLGYTHHWVDPLTGESSQESRPYQDYLWTDDVGSGFKATIRSRLEEMIPITGPNSNDLDLGKVGIRIRQLAGISHPIPGLPGLSIYLSDEGWFFLNDNAFGQGGFDQNRAAGGLNYKATKHLDFSLGYMGQYIHSQRNARNDLFTHNVQFGLHYNF
jgi:hypothetical protein